MSSSARTLELSSSQRQLLQSLSIRAGSGLDGLESPNGLDALDGALSQPPLRLSAEVLSVKRVPADSGVSYGHSYRTDSETTLALVSIGYGHGIPRKAGNRASVTWWDSSTSESVVLPIVGRVAMDVLVVDAGNVAVVAGDLMVLFGDPERGEISLEDFSASIGENPASVVGALDSRVTRVEHS